MTGLIHNEVEKILRQWRFVIVLIVYTLLALFIGIESKGAAGMTAASTDFQWVTSGFAGFLIPLSLCVLLGDSLAGEFSSGTMKLLLIRPRSRWKIWLSKYIAALGASLVAVLYLGVCFYVSVGFSNGYGSWAAHPPALLKSGYDSFWALTWRAYALESLAVAAFVSFVLLVSTVTRSGIAALGLCAAAVVLGMILTNAADKIAGSSFLLFSHLQIVDHLTQTFPVPTCSLAQSILPLRLGLRLRRCQPLVLPAPRRDRIAASRIAASSPRKIGATYE